MASRSIRTGIYPGTFDPMTNGHLDIIRRAILLVDHLIVAIGVNIDKTPLFSFQERAILIEAETKLLSKKLGVKLTVVSFSGLLINAADAHGANIIIRGVRSVIDYEYEAQMISINRTMNSRIETVLLSASPKTQFISSTIVRQISSMGGDISNFVPKRVEKKFLERQMQKKKGQ